MTQKPADPGFKIHTKRGHVIEVSTESELEAVARVLGLKPEKPPEARQPRAERLAHRQALLLVLKELARREKPLNTAQVADLVGLRTSKGLSSQTRVWSKILLALGVELGDAVSRFRDRDSYWWESGPKIQQAITALEKAE